MTYESELARLDAAFEGDDNRSAAALNVLLSAFGGKYTTRYRLTDAGDDYDCIECRVANHSANMARVRGNNGDNYLNVTVHDDGIYVTGVTRSAYRLDEADKVLPMVEAIGIDEYEPELS